MNFFDIKNIHHFNLKANKKETIVNPNKAKKLSFKLEKSAKKPSKTGPIKKPIKPEAAINAIP